MKNVFVVIPNWNGKDFIGKSLDSLHSQLKHGNIIVVDNGSEDGSIDFIEKNYPDIILVKNKSNLGFAGGVNKGIKKAMDLNADFIALLNNDAVANKEWLINLYNSFSKNDKIGIVTSKILDTTGKKIDSTGDFYTSWFLAYSRGRDEIDSGKYDNFESVTSASGGASIYSAKMLREIGIFDEDFFAYYEDLDLSLRALHSGWKIYYQPKAIVNHKTGSTSSKIKGFTTYQTIKNLPLVIIKNVPTTTLIRNLLKFNFAYLLFFIRSIPRGHLYYSLKGFLRMIILIPSKLIERKSILSKTVLSDKQFDMLLAHDLPPDARGLRIIRKLLTFGLR